MCQCNGLSEIPDKAVMVSHFKGNHENHEDPWFWVLSVIDESQTSIRYEAIMKRNI